LTQLSETDMYRMPNNLYQIILNPLLITLLLSPAVTQADKGTDRPWVVGSEQDYPPLAIGNTDESAGGFSIELWKAVARESNINYTIQIRPFHEILQKFKEGKIDILINLAESDERRRFADFTVPTVVVQGALFVRKQDLSIRSEADLAGKSIIVVNADRAHDYALSKGWQKQLVLVDRVETGFKRLASKQDHVLLVNKLVGMQTLDKLKISSIKALNLKSGFSQKFAFAVHKDNADLLARINEGLALTKANGQYDSVYEKWLGVYEDTSISLQHLFIYLIPIVMVFLGIIFIVFYQRLSERRVTVKKLEEAHNLLKTIIDTAPLRIFWKDTNSCYLGCNPAFAKDAGAALPEDIIGKDDYQLAWKEQAGRYRADDRKIMISGRSRISYDEPQTTPDRQQIWLRTSKIPLRNHNNKIIGVLGIYEDITRQKEIETALRKLFLAVEQSPSSIIICDLNAKIEYVNPAFSRETGYSLSEALGQNPRFLSAGKTPQETYNAMWAALKEGEAWQGELINRRKDGSEYIESALISPVRQADNHISHYLAIKENISRRKQAEAELRIAAVAFEAQEGMVITDAERIIIRINHAFTHITGYTAQEAVGQRLTLLKSGRHSQAFYSTMWASIQDIGSWQGEVWSRRKNGEIYPEWLTLTAVNGEDGKPIHYVGTMTDITLRKAAEDEIERLAFFDPLTQLPNRRLLLDRLQKALIASARSAKYGALLFIDLDNFKNLNDTLGHDMGDALLQQVAQRLTFCMRESDTVARQGGDEFVVMLVDLGATPEEAAALAKIIGEKIITTLNQPYRLAAQYYYSTPSIGIALFIHPLNTMEDLLKQADIAMYRAKAAGRNTLRFFDPQMQAEVNARSLLTENLHHALEENQLKPYFHMQVNRDHKIIGAEILLRWEHPEHGLISPLEFISLAEETGLIVSIGHWVLQTACTQLKRWTDNPQAQHLHLTINISTRQFHHAGFVEEVAAILKNTAINPDLLKLELTENVIRNNIEESIIKMQLLKKMGLHFSLDDFGTGYSSLSYLTQLPLDQLKIDKSFIHNIGVKTSDAIIIQTIIAMANNLGIEVIAEGVETEEQRSFLELHGCLACQGYLFGMPVPLIEFEKLLESPSMR
jgi:diguanylate cyclase (GGDEF)-like protein/PAS domain S-box-containing protein